MTAIKNKAFSLLSRKGYFSKELALKLKEKGYEKKEIEPLIVEFQKKGFLNDEEMKKSFIRSQKNKGYGAKIILHKLKMKAGEMKTEIEDEMDEVKTLILKKYVKKLPEQKDKVIQALLRRGFSYQLITEALQNL